MSIPSFGFILSFIPAVWMSKICSLNFKSANKKYIVAVFVGQFIIYLIGISYMSFILIFYMSNDINFWRILTIGMLLFIPGDIIKSIVAISISKRLSYIGFTV